LNVTYELDNSFPEDFSYKKISVDDNGFEDIHCHFDDAISFIDEGRKSKESVFVHCAAGISRSPTIILAYLMKMEHMNLSSSFKYLKDKRHCICPNSGFMNQLVQFEIKLFNSSTIDVLHYHKFRKSYLYNPHLAVVFNQSDNDEDAGDDDDDDEDESRDSKTQGGWFCTIEDSS